MCVNYNIMVLFGLYNRIFQEEFSSCQVQGELPIEIRLDQTRFFE